MKLALTNCPPSHADSIARALVEERLAACVNALPVRSVYRWKGAIEREDEVTLLIKTTEGAVEQLRERLVALHPYELPEFLVLDVDASASLAAYVRWVESEVLPPPPLSPRPAGALCARHEERGPHPAGKGKRRL